MAARWALPRPASRLVRPRLAASTRPGAQAGRAAVATGPLLANPVGTPFSAAGAPVVQVCLVQLGRDTVLVGRQGTRLSIPARSFDVPAGSGPVRLEMQEYLRTADIVLAGLSTSTGPDLLETGGMLRLRATQAGRVVWLRPEATLLFQFSGRPYKPGMRLYEGVATADRPFDWRRPGAATDSALTAGWRRFDQQFGDRSQLILADGPGFQSVLGFDVTGGVLNWVNCDRLLQPGPRIRFAMTAPDADTFVTLVFRAQRCILAGTRQAGNVTEFAQVPDGAPVTVVALRRQGNAVYLATAFFRLRPAAQPVMRFRQVTLSEFRAEMEQL